MKNSIISYEKLQNNTAVKILFFIIIFSLSMCLVSEAKTVGWDAENNELLTSSLLYRAKSDF